MDYHGALNYLRNAYAEGGTVSADVDWKNGYGGGKSSSSSKPANENANFDAAASNPFTGYALSSLVSPTSVGNFAIGRAVSAALGPVGSLTYSLARMLGFNPTQGIMESSGLSTPTSGFQGGYWGKQGVGEGVNPGVDSSASLRGALASLGGAPAPTNDQGEGIGFTGGLSTPQSIQSILNYSAPKAAEPDAVESLLTALGGGDASYGGWNNGGYGNYSGGGYGYSGGQVRGNDAGGQFNGYSPGGDNSGISTSYSSPSSDGGGD